MDEEFFVTDAEGKKIHVLNLRIGVVVYHVDRKEFGHILGFERLKLNEVHNYLNLRVRFASVLYSNRELAVNPQNLIIWA